MAGGLLILTFHKPGATLAEDLLFKRAALDSGLIGADAIENAGPVPPQLLADDRISGSGLIQKKDATNALLTTFNQVGTAAWDRPAFRRGAAADSILETWMKKVVSTPIECLVLAGHHSEGQLWGLEMIVDDTHRPYTKFVPDAAARTIEIAGHPRGAGLAVSRAGPFDVRQALRTCRLLLIWGCNGAASEQKHWGPWRDLLTACSGAPPVILGYYKTHRWPLDTAPERFSPDLWRRLRALAGTTHSISSLCRDKPADVINAWASSMKDTFASSAHCNQHLFFQRKYTKTCEGYGPRGAGAVDPDGVVWHIVNAAGKLEARGPRTDRGDR